MSQMFVVILVGSPKHGRLPAPPHEASWVLSCTVMRQMHVLEPYPPLCQALALLAGVQAPLTMGGDTQRSQAPGELPCPYQPLTPPLGAASQASQMERLCTGLALMMRGYAKV